MVHVKRNMKWDFFDEIYCINLYTAEDRYLHVQKLAKKYGIPIKFYRTHRHVNGGLQGCFESHINVIKKAYENGSKNILVLEDDLQPGTLTQEQLNRAVNFMKKNKFWAIFYLGATPDIRKGSCHKVGGFPSVYQLKSICTHAYAINRRTMKKLKDLTYQGTQIDYYFRDNLKCYGIYPSVFYQGGFESSITVGFDWHARVLPGIVGFYFRMLEFYAYHVGFSLAQILTILATCILWFVLRIHKKVPSLLLPCLLFAVFSYKIFIV